MKLRTGIVVIVVLVAVGVVAGVALAQMTDSQTASGTITATSTSADLYICEPDSTPGPACGSDDSGADETVFETLEDIRPGDTVQWDIRLRNGGTVDWTVTTVTLTVVEILDPGADCPANALLPGRYPPTAGISEAGVFVLGKAGDDLNDNAAAGSVQGAHYFTREFNANTFPSAVHIRVAAGDYEDLRLRLQLSGSGTENCDGNEWNVSWAFTSG